MTSETIDNRLSSFLAVFFRILAVKSSELNTTKEITVMDDRKEFFLKELNQAKKIHTNPMKLFYNLRFQGWGDVLVTKKTYLTEPFTALQVLDPGWLFFRKTWCPFKKGYDYYFQGKKHEYINGYMQNTVVRTRELEMEFRKHLPVLRFLCVDAMEQHQLPDTAKEDHRSSMGWEIYAHFEGDMTLETIDNLVANFFAAFFTILEDKSSTLSVQTMT